MPTFQCGDATIRVTHRAAGTLGGKLTSPTSRRGSNFAFVGLLTLLAVAYVVAAKAGLVLAFVNPSATAVWPPTGITIGANILFGYRVWPAFLLGAFVANWTTAGSLGTSVLIAVGNTLEGFIGAWLVNRFARGRGAFQTPSGVFKFALIASAAPVASATIGVTSLSLGGYSPWPAYSTVWLTWWLGDASGALIVTPLLLLWSQFPNRSHRSRWLEGVCLLLATGLVSEFAFGGLGRSFSTDVPVDVICIPILTWAAFRFGPRATSTTAFLMSGIAIWGTWRGVGPFVRSDPNQSLLLLQIFMAVLTITSMALAAAVQDRARLLADEQELRSRAEAAERHRSQIIKALPEGIVVTDREGRTILSNAAAEAIVGPSKSGLDGYGYAYMGVWRPDGTAWPPDETPLARAIHRGETVQGEQMLVLNPLTGTRVPVLASAAPVYDSQGTLIGAVTVFQDITSQRELEQQKEEFLSAAAHDLKTPLTNIRGWAQMLERHLDRRAELAPEINEALATIIGATNKMNGLVDELLDSSRQNIQRGIDLVLEPADLVEMARRVLNEHSRNAHRHTLRLESIHASLVGHLDPVRLERVLTNLVSNAIKYSPDGGEIVVSIAAEDREFRRWAILAVRDEGLGIPAAELPRIFDRFQRGSNVLGRIDGTGVGLAYVREIVVHHGGRVFAESQEGTGSTITVELPLDTRRL